MSALPVNPTELLAAMASGDQRALDAPRTAPGRRACACLRACSYPGSGLDVHAVADEVTVDVFHDIWRAPMRYDGRVAFGTWLLTLARNKAVDQIRRHGKRLAREVPLDSDSEEQAQQGLRRNTIRDHRWQGKICNGAMPC